MDLVGRRAARPFSSKPLIIPARFSFASLPLGLRVIKLAWAAFQASLPNHCGFSQFLSPRFDQLNLVQRVTGIPRHGCWSMRLLRFLR